MTTAATAALVFAAFVCAERLYRRHQVSPAINPMWSRVENGNRAPQSLAADDGARFPGHDGPHGEHAA